MRTFVGPVVGAFLGALFAWMARGGSTYGVEHPDPEGLLFGLSGSLLLAPIGALGGFTIGSLVSRREGQSVRMRMLVVVGGAVLGWVSATALSAALG